MVRTRARCLARENAPRRIAAARGSLAKTRNARKRSRGFRDGSGSSSVAAIAGRSPGVARGGQSGWIRARRRTRPRSSLAFDWSRFDRARTCGFPLTVLSAGILTSTSVPTACRCSPSTSPSLYVTVTILGSAPLAALPGASRPLTGALRARDERRVGAASPSSPS